MLLKAIVAVLGCISLKYWHSMLCAGKSLSADAHNLNSFFHALDEIKTNGLVNAIKRNGENPDTDDVVKQIFDTYSENNSSSKNMDHKEILKYGAEAISGLSSTSLYNYSWAHHLFGNKIIGLNTKLLEKIQFDFHHQKINYEALDTALIQDSHLNDLKEISSDFAVNLLHIFNARHKIEQILLEDIAPELSTEIGLLHASYLDDTIV
ncbi:MAG: hypothetical protein ACK5WS_06710 [Alphaproteobacteria bacterium]|jgi:hypothetical protein|nr:hypothetical protein [Candidatus Jidaibacter sp.]